MYLQEHQQLQVTSFLIKHFYINVVTLTFLIHTVIILLSLFSYFPAFGGTEPFNEVVNTIPIENTKTFNTTSFTPLHVAWKVGD